MATPSPVLHTLKSATGSLRVNGGRLWRSLMELAQIGATPKGGVRRLALTDLDGQGRDLVVQWLRDANASVEIDGAGNIFATRRGRDAAAPARSPVCIRSSICCSSATSMASRLATP